MAAQQRMANLTPSPPLAPLRQPWPDDDPVESTSTVDPMWLRQSSEFSFVAQWHLPGCSVAWCGWVALPQVSSQIVEQALPYH